MAASDNSLKLPVPDSFPAFPYNPYPIQIDLMQHVYSSIENRQVAIVESPTGTGKTLSLLCSSLSWLADEKERVRKGQLLSQARSDEPDWVAAHTMEKRQRELEAQNQEYEQRLATARKKEAALKKKARAKRLMPDADLSDDDTFLPDDDGTEPADEGDNFSPAVRALRESYQRQPSIPEEPTCTKIYYASRTHSQLSQILPELRKLKFKHSSPPRSNDDDDENDSQQDDQKYYKWRTVSLGSRKQLCINDAVKLKHGDLDERCRKLREEKADKRCEHLPGAEDELRMLELRDQILATPKDIEDLAAAGRNALTCPYYGSRRAIPQAELVTLPYNLLLQRPAREALGIDLTDQIVVIDEAHNLIPTLLALSSTRLTRRTLSTSLHQLSVYFQKFRNRLSAGHVLHLKRLITFLEAVQKHIAEWKSSKDGVQKLSDKVEVMTPQEFVQRLGRKVDGINLLEIETYLRNSKVARKISGYCEKVAGVSPLHDSSAGDHIAAAAPLLVVEGFMQRLAAASEDGRIILSIIKTSDGDDVEVKYQLLNPSTIFRDVADVSRCVVLAGGTMSPIQDVVNQLFAYFPTEKLSTFSCGHIIPASNIQALVVGKGPRGGDLEFNYRGQSDKQMIAELGQIIFNLCSIVPGGLVVFFPSYSYLNVVKEEWGSTRMLEKFEGKKKVFMEPPDSSEVEAVLREYAVEARSSNVRPRGRRAGAVLFAVIGAKLSEGLNFSDELARAVVIVGLPFANKTSPDLRERMKYANEMEARRGVKRNHGEKDAASELYENMCMNAVNQSIGRAIRHRSDWASLILVDRRYRSSAIQAKLPRWIASGIMATETFGQTVKQLGTFFRDKRS
ncbi:hypothetical protein SERLADRAFT_349743 [Serpula lacrymans var. lacrymans S7.9]|uniref:ATP-dependent DNA helicase CHL1 n=1 Tax=Serpula lacrymans var. lacrymans (strain S7.9) TaxID=578457 RepID=F8NYD8_SERL9|nr:uncharacterized protein SERLADRAFT_349743 [Serpula lacrymans var. lacrymans S7.9]EGO23609.1 hypothetical protein SERLADRAFT_349743 [Serpula lacrymans var. lacrymans S7.9]